MTDPATPPQKGDSKAKSQSPGDRSAGSRGDRSAGSDDSLVNPPGYVSPEQQDMMLFDVTSDILHGATLEIGRGKEYLSPADSFPLSWPVTGVIFGHNKRLMINLPCRRAKPDRGHNVLNVFFLVDTGSPVSYLCKEAMDALIGRELDQQLKQLSIVIQTTAKYMEMNLSPMTSHFQDVNVLGMDFLDKYDLSMVVDMPVSRFKFLQKELASMEGDYDEETSFDEEQNKGVK